MIGLVLAAVSAALLLAMALAGWMPLSLVVFLLILGTLAFGLVAPNALHEVMQPLPQIAGATGAASGCIQMAEYAAISREYDRTVNQPVARRLNCLLSDLGVRPLSMTLFDSVVALADAYLQLTVPSFEFPRSFPPSVHFIGALPIIPNQAPLPSWAHELDGSRKVVLVTQGTVANHDFGLLIAPTLAALANEPDLLVVVTAGGRSIDDIPGPIPGNARLASYLPFEWLLPKVDVLVTNGGYGSVNQALSFGVPLVTAGLTEDKADVNVRVAWSGIGINLATNEPTPQALREAIRTVLDKTTYRSRASSMAEEFKAIDTRSEILRIVGQVSHTADEDSLRRGQAAVKVPDEGAQAQGIRFGLRDARRGSSRAA